MELKGGKLHQLITDQDVNSNRIFANRYDSRGLIGAWYFIIDCIQHFENALLVFLISLIGYSMQSSTTSSAIQAVPLYFPVTAFVINIILMSIRNVIFEVRQKKITLKINNKLIEYLNVSRTTSKFVPIVWEKVKPGQVIRIRKGQEFPADCLILDIQGQSGQKCYVTCGPFDDSTGIVQKKSFTSTSNKTGQRQNE